MYITKTGLLYWSSPVCFMVHFPLPNGDLIFAQLAEQNLATGAWVSDLHTENITTKKVSDFSET